jgi:hypothetical protein
MDGACKKMEEMINVNNIFVEKSERKRTLGK